eukprot:5056547-Pleurochrysis_carterae.AAC.1
MIRCTPRAWSLHRSLKQERVCGVKRRKSFCTADGAIEARPRGNATRAERVYTLRRRTSTRLVATVTTWPSGASRQAARRSPST